MDPPTKPVIVVVDSEADASNTVEQLMARYSHDYTIVVDPDVVSASQRMRALAEAASDVALILADRAANGAMLLDEARTVHPHARRALLLNWNESRSYREEIAAAFAQRRAEGSVTKPSGTPDERFHRSITELLDEWWRIRGPRTTAVHIVCAARTPRVSEMCDLRGLTAALVLAMARHRVTVVDDQTHRNAKVAEFHGSPTRDATSTNGFRKDASAELHSYA